MLSSAFKEQFWSKVEKTNSCWIWIGGLSEGYGSTKGLDGRQDRAHRVAYELTYGPIPDSLFVCHKCDSNYMPGDRSYRRCVRPDHLFLGTALDNARDMVAKGRSATGKRHRNYTHPESRPRGDRHGTHTHPESRCYGDRSPSRLHPEKVSRGDAHWTRQYPDKVVRGEAHGHARMTEEGVRLIRALAAEGLGVRAIGHRMNYDASSVSKILKGKLWQHVSAT